MPAGAGCKYFTTNVLSDLISKPGFLQMVDLKVRRPPAREPASRQPRVRPAGLSRRTAARGRFARARRLRRARARRRVRGGQVYPYGNGKLTGSTIQCQASRGGWLL